MDERLQIAEAVRQACIDAAIHAYEDAGLSGLCHEGRWEYALMLHAQTEEDVLYPTAILIGEYLKLKLDT